MLLRRQVLHLAGVAVLPVFSRVARAQAYPTRPVRLIVGFAAGSSPDLDARVIGQWLAEHLGQSFVVDNRPGAGTNIGTEAVVRAAPDGYTLLFASAPNAINATLYDNLNFNFIKDIAPVAFVQRVPLILVVAPSASITTVPEFIAYAKSNPGKISFGSGGIGTASHLTGELFKFMSGINMVHVPYRGGGGTLLNDLLGGQVQAAFLGLPTIKGFVDTGKLRPLAVTSAERLVALPNIPAIGDFVQGYEAAAWEGLCAPKSSPPDIIERLNQETNAGLADPKVKTRLSELGGVPRPMSPADFGKFIAADTEKWAKVIKAVGVKPG